MTTFYMAFSHVLREFFCRRNCIILLILILSALLLFQIGIFKHEKILIQKECFQKTEEALYSTFLNYRQLGTYGIAMLFIPDKFSSFSVNTALVNVMDAYIDSGIRLKLNASLLSSNMFKQKKYGFMDFSGIFYYLFTLVFCFLGLETVIHKEYLKTHASIFGRKKSFLFLFLPRLIIIGLIIAVILCLALFQAVLNHIDIPIDKHLLVFYLEILTLSTFFFLLGSALGKIRPITVGVIFIVISWIIIIFVLPTIVNSITETRADTLKPQYELNLKKLQKFSLFEKYLKQKKGPAKVNKKITKSLRQMINTYRAKQFKEILEMEYAMHRKMLGTAKFYQRFAMFFPSTFYISVSEELSSMGYLNLLDFYLYTIKLKAEFVDFILKKIYFENFSKVVPFLKDNENIYHATPRIPGTFVPGLLLNLIYIFILGIVNYILFKKTIFEPSEFIKDDEIKRLSNINLNYRQHYIFKIFGNKLLKRMYNIFSGQSFLKNKAESSPWIFLESVDITNGKFDETFLYICSPTALPRDMSARSFFNFIGDINRYPIKQREELASILKIENLGKKKIRELKRHEKAGLLLAMSQMTDRKAYLFHDVACGLNRPFTEQFKALIEKLTSRGSVVVYLTNDTTITEYRDEELNGYLDKTADWNSHVDQYKEKY